MSETREVLETGLKAEFEKLKAQYESDISEIKKRLDALESGAAETEEA